MPDVLRESAVWLEEQRRQYRTASARYCRGAECTTLPVTVGRTDYETSDDAGTIVGAQTVDVIVSASDFVPVFTRPKIGDRITVDGRVLEVLAVGRAGCWRWSDEYALALRIHTREIDA